MDEKKAHPYYVKGLAMGMIAYLLGVHLWTWVFSVGTFLSGDSDFRAFYGAGYMVRSGQADKLYDRIASLAVQYEHVSHDAYAFLFIHPAYEALLYAPLSCLPYKTAYWVFVGTNLALLGICLSLLRTRMRNLKGIYPWLPVGMFLAFLPVAATLLNGQDSIVLLLLLVAATVSLGNDREMTAGAFVGLGLFRFQIVLPIAFLFLLWRRWRFCSGFAVLAIPCSVLSMWLVGISGIETYAHALFSMSIAKPSQVESGYAQPVRSMPNLRGLVSGLAGNHMSGTVQAMIVILSVAILICVAYSASSRKLDALAPSCLLSRRALLLVIIS